MSRYLVDHLETVQDLPPRMGETMTSVAALDGRLQGLCRQLDHDVGHVARLRARYLIEQGSGNMHGRGRRSNTRGGKCEDGASSTTSTNKAQSWRTAEVAKIQERIEKAMNLCVRLGDEKIRIVQHGYDFLDTHIRRLDEDLKRMEADLRRRDLLPPPEMERSASQRKRRRASSEAEASLSTGSTAGQQVDLPVDPNEPVYCICKQVAFGEMVACDNPACEDGEWYHFSCVNLSKRPTGRWLCPGCTARRKQAGKGSTVS